MNKMLDEFLKDIELIEEAANSLVEADEEVVARISSMSIQEFEEFLKQNK